VPKIRGLEAVIQQTTQEKKIRVGLVGASGYGGIQLVRLILDHPHLELSYLGGSSTAGQEFGQIYPHMAPWFNNQCEAIDVKTISERCDVVFLAAPNGVALELAPELVERGLRVLDLSADYRFTDLAVYEQWYGKGRKDQSTNAKAVYGLPELFRERIAHAALVGCPGCYPTASLLAAAPLLKQGLVATESLIIDAKSGVSGAGRVAKQGSLFAETDSSVGAYGVTQHRHTPEIEQVCSELSGHNLTLQFTPHLIPMTRGILVTLYAQLRDPGLVTEDLNLVYAAFYRQAPFVTVLDVGVYPHTKWVAGTNSCYIGLAVDPRTERVIVLAVIDNLLKGQSGQAMQCLNIMMGWPEDLGLPKVAFYP
jgi:N-acetyl-gamma-glutamyl-phosphate reductase